MEGVFEQIVSLEWMAENPIMFESIDNKEVLRPYNESARHLLYNERDKLPGKMFYKNINLSY